MNEFKLIIPTQTFLGKKIETLGIWLSGGVDSSLLLYLLIKKIQDDKIPIMVQPVIVEKKDNISETKIILEKIIELLNCKTILKDLLIYDISNWVDNDYHKTFYSKNIENVINGKYEYIYSGITKNPPLAEQEQFKFSIIPELEKIRQDDIKKIIIFNAIFYENGEVYETGEIRPFFHLHKKDIKKMYETNNLMDSIFPFTCSCVEMTKKGHCGHCWFCKERLWGFGQL